MKGMSKKKYLEKYESPKLKKYGKISSLTTGGSANAQESSSAPPEKKRP